MKSLDLISKIFHPDNSHLGFCGVYYFYFFLAMPHGMWNLSSPTRDWTHVPCGGSTESQLLDHQGSPWILVIFETSQRVISSFTEILLGCEAKMVWSNLAYHEHLLQ